MEEEELDELVDDDLEDGDNLFQVIFSYDETTHEVHVVAANSPEQVRKVISESFEHALKVRKDLSNLQIKSITPFVSPTLQ